MQTPLETLQAALPEWCTLWFPFDDIPDAYSGVPVRPDHARGNIIGLWSPESSQWMYVAQQGLGFGLTSAVPTFCRSPTLAAAASRRVLCLASGAYFDDCPVVETEAEASSGLTEDHHDREDSRRSPACNRDQETYCCSGQFVEQAADRRGSWGGSKQARTCDL